MKVGKKSESFYILGYLLELIIKSVNFKNFFFGEIWRIWAIFSMENPLPGPKAYFSGRNLAKFRQKKHWVINIIGYKY
jgi:hypothetical protein